MHAAQHKKAQFYAGIPDRSIAVPHPYGIKLFLLLTGSTSKIFYISEQARTHRAISWSSAYPEPDVKRAIPKWRIKDSTFHKNSQLCDFRLSLLFDISGRIFPSLLISTCTIYKKWQYFYLLFEEISEAWKICKIQSQVTDQFLQIGQEKCAKYNRMDSCLFNETIPNIACGWFARGSQILSAHSSNAARLFVWGHLFPQFVTDKESYKNSLIKILWGSSSTSGSLDVEWLKYMPMGTRFACSAGAANHYFM